MTIDKKWLKLWGIRVLGLGAVILPALLIVGWVDRYATNVPVWDDWERASLLEAWKGGTLTWNDLWAPHIEHRMVVPRVLILANAATGGDLRTEIWMTYLIVLATAAGTCWLAYRTGFRGVRFWAAAFGACLLIFSPIQWENFLWASQKAIMMPSLALVGATLVLSATRLSFMAKWWLCLGCALLGSLSFTHGLLLWPLVLLYVALEPVSGDRTGRRVFMGVWSVVSVAFFLAYFTDFRNVSVHAYTVNPGDAPQGVQFLDEALNKPGRLLQFAGVIAGGLHARTLLFLDPGQVAPWLGWAAILTFVSLAVWACLCMRQHPRWSVFILPWLALGATSLATIAMLTLGRGAVPVTAREFAPRYVSLTIFFWIGLFALGYFASQEISRSFSPRGRRYAQHAWVLLLGFYLATQVEGWSYGVEKMRHWHAARCQAKTQLLFAKHFEPEIQTRFAASFAVAKHYADRLEAVDMLGIPMLEDRLLSNFKQSSSVRATSQARFLEALWDPQGQSVVVKGFANLPKVVGRPSDGVLITCPNAAREEEIIAIAEIVEHATVPIFRYDAEFDGTRKVQVRDWCAWEKRIDLREWPAERPLVLRAWAVDAARMKVYPIEDTHRIFPEDPGATMLTSNRAPP